MTIVRSCNSTANSDPLCSFVQASDVQDVSLLTARVNKLILSFQIVDAGSHLSAASMTILDNVTGTPLPISNAIGACSFVDNVVTFTTGLSVAYSTIVLENLGTNTILQFAFTGFPASPPGTTVFIGQAIWQ